MTYYETPGGAKVFASGRLLDDERDLDAADADADGEPVGAALEGLERRRDVDVVALSPEDGGGPVCRLLA